MIRLLGRFYSFHAHSRINLHFHFAAPGRTSPLRGVSHFPSTDSRFQVPVPPRMSRCAMGSSRKRLHAPASPRLGRPTACDKASHRSAFSPVRTFSTTSGVIPAKCLVDVTLCLPSIIDSDQPRRVQVAGRVRQSKPSLDFLACAHVFNNFWGYPGKTPSYRHLSPFLDHRGRPITPRLGHRTSIPIMHISQSYQLVKGNLAPPGDWERKRLAALLAVNLRNPHVNLGTCR